LAVDAATDPPRWLAPLRLGRDAVLRSYAQILFSRSRVVGALVILGTAIVPRVALYGLLATLLAFGVTRVFRLSEDLTATGLFGYNALLVGLGAGLLFGPTLDAQVLTVVGVVTAVFMTAALYSALGAAFNLPPLTLPFLFVFYLVIGAARILDVPLGPLLAEQAMFAIDLPRPINLFLQSLGALFFLPRADVGLVVLFALLFHSRIAVLLAVFGFAMAYLLEGRLLLVMDGTLPMVLGYNFVLTAIALGGVWFIPSPSSMLLAVGASLVCGLAAIGLVPLMSIQALPLLILPFNLTLILVMYAMRQRTRDGRPKAVDFPIGTPEQNLNYFRTRVARFGARYVLRFRAPFLGRWVCTQGVDGKHTHRNQWRHAFDFEVQDASGKTFRGEGSRPQDYLCYRLPVLAAADGTVARIIDDVEDSPIGQPNLQHNWGNLVLLYHAPGLYSLVCHLARGSIKVREGQFVRRGDVVGLCGSSGRSPVPHLHFQFQGTPTIGAPTLETELHDVVLETDTGANVASTLVAGEGDVVRNLEPTDVPLGLPGAENVSFVFEVEADGGTRTETLITEIDLLGARVIRSSERTAHAYYDQLTDLFRIYDTVGDRRSVVHLLQAALPTVPLEVGEGLRWTDHLQLRYFLRLPAQFVLDFISPFVNNTALEMHYSVTRNGEKTTIEGRSTRQLGGQSYVQTKATFDAAGLSCVEVRSGVRHRTARRSHPEKTDAAA